MVYERKAMMVTWDDTHLLSTVCLMVDSEKEKVFDSKTQEFSNYKELEQIFDNLLNDSYTLA